MFLFNDCLVLTKYDVFAKVAEDGTKKSKKKFTFKDFILFDQLIVVSIPNVEGMCKLHFKCGSSFQLILDLIFIPQ